MFCNKIFAHILSISLKNNLQESDFLVFINLKMMNESLKRHSKLFSLIFTHNFIGKENEAYRNNYAEFIQPKLIYFNYMHNDPSLFTN